MTVQSVSYNIRPIDRAVLAAKNAAYLQSLRAGQSDHDLRSQILGSVFDYCADAILVFDQDKRIVLANETAALISGWDLEDVSREELRRRFKFCSDVTLKEVPVEDEPLEVALRERKPCLREGLVIGDSLPSHGVWVRVHAAPIFGNDKLAGVITVIQDISERVRIERQRDSLVSLIAHDLKNHLASESILLAFNRDSTMLSADEREQLMQELAGSTEQFLTITDTLMELSRAQFFASQSDHDVDVRQILENCIAANQPRARQTNVKLQLIIAADVRKCMGLPAVVGQLCTNIILNAIEASPHGATVQVTADLHSLDPLSSNCVRIQVIDQGPGMSEDQLAMLFDPQRVAAHNKRSTHSTGFGLYLTYMLVETLGGTMTCASKPGEGLTVTIDLAQRTTG